MITIDELNQRHRAFKNIMDRENPQWTMALILGKVNQFYLSGTMQDGILVIQRDSDPIFWVRRSVERAQSESHLRVESMSSYRIAAGHYNNLPSTIFLEREIIPLALYDRLQKAFGFTQSKPIDRQLLKIRSVKSESEITLIKDSGKIHSNLMDSIVPSLLKEGMSEMDFSTELFSQMLKVEYQGVSRFSMFQTEIVLGQIGFGENSCYPSYFNGPGGSRGQSAAVPLLGERERRLKKGEMVFADVAFGYRGYHTDHTMTYLFQGDLPTQAREYHNYCLKIQEAVALRLVPGEIPSRIYNETIEMIGAEAPKGFADCFMGKKGNQVKFLGHGVGLHIDEYPVIARGFDEPLEENMIIALEPKCAVELVGTVGVENTFIVTPQGGISLTGKNPGMIDI